jgi:hypothetical protein
MSETMNSSGNPACGRSRPGLGWKRITAGLLTLVLLLWLGFAAFIWRSMHRPPEAFARVMSHLPWQVFLILPFETLWTRARAGSLRVGDRAPDFSLLTLDKTETIRFSELNRKQPVVMIFGSYT